MRKVLLLLFCCVQLHAFSQITIPTSALRSPRKTAELKGYNLTDTSGKEESPSNWLPSIKNSDYFEKDATKFFQNNLIGYNDSLSDISLYSEIANDFLGPFRVSVGMTLAYPKTDTSSVLQKQINKEKFVQKFSTGGGALVFNFVIPVYANYGKTLETIWTAGPRFSLDPPSFGVSSNGFANNTSLGTDLQVRLRGFKQVIKFYGAGRLSYVAGNSIFYDGLQLTGSDRKGFWFNNYMVGVNIKDVFTISYTKFWGSSNVTDRLSGFLTFTVEPNF